MLMEEVVRLDTHEKASLRLTELQVRLALISLLVPILSTCVANDSRDRQRPASVVTGLNKASALPLQAVVEKADAKASEVTLKASKSHPPQRPPALAVCLAKGRWRTGEPFDPYD